METKVSTITTSTSPQFPELVALYRATLPAHVREPVEELAWALDTPSDPLITLAVVAEVDGKVAGYAIVQYVPAENYLLLAYLGTDPAVRGHGLGSALYQAALAQAITVTWERFRRVPDGMFIECEKGPLLPDDVESLEICQRRVRFYQRLGAELVTDFNYLEPATGTGGDLWTPMHLLYHPIATWNPSRGRMKAMLLSIYTHIYRRRNVTGQPIWQRIAAAA